MTRNASIVFSLVLFCSTASPALAVPVQGPNGHHYEFILAIEIRWDHAQSAAAARSFLGVPGYLATITSAEENQFLATAFPERGGSDQNGFLGGYQDVTAADYSEPAGGWRWVTGETWSYTNWFSGVPTQPDDYEGGQNYAHSNVGWQWGDIQLDPKNPSIQYISGYFVEYSTVPEPATLLPLLLALVGTPAS